MTEEFKIWWEAFPKGDGFTIRGKKFPRTRALRLNEAKCEKKFVEILKKKSLTLAAMLKALNSETTSRMENSYRSGKNEMRYMSNSYAYLNGGAYEAWLDDEDEEENSQNSPNAEVINPKDLF